MLSRARTRGLLSVVAVAALMLAGSAHAALFTFRGCGDRLSRFILSRCLRGSLFGLARFSRLSSVLLSEQPMRSFEYFIGLVVAYVALAAAGRSPVPVPRALQQTIDARLGR